MSDPSEKKTETKKTQLPREKKKAEKKPREAMPGELRGIALLEALERFFRRPETRIDAQRMLNALSEDGRTYAKHLVMSGPSANSEAAQACEMTVERLEKAMDELEKAIRKLMG
jgi:hypothetical protein